MESIAFRLIGTQPLLMNNPETVNPLLPKTKAIKAITSKRKKTDAELAELASLKFTAAIYFDPEVGVFTPSSWVWKAGEQAAKKTKQGTLWGEAVISVSPRKAPLVYKGPKTVKELYGKGDTNFVHITDGRIGTSRVMAVRPIFEEWSFDSTIEFDEEILDPADIVTIMFTAGHRIGVGTWRTQFGRFRIVVIGAHTSVDVSKICKLLGVEVL